MAIGLRTAALDKQVEDLCDNFTTYLDAFNGDPLFKGVDLSYHIVTLDLLRNKFGGAANSIDSEGYLHALYFTLEAWGMNRPRGKAGSKMQEYDKFAASVRKYKNGIAAREGEVVAQIDNEITQKLWGIIQGMDLSQRTPQIVTGAKALHHLLPELLPPIDREYTQPFFHYDDDEFKDADNHEHAFRRMLWYFARIAQEIDLGRYVGREKWETSQSKLIDNAIIGYCLLHHGLRLKYKRRNRIYKSGVLVDTKPHIAGCQRCKEMLSS